MQTSNLQTPSCPQPPRFGACGQRTVKSIPTSKAAVRAAGQSQPRVKAKRQRRGGIREQYLVVGTLQSVSVQTRRLQSNECLCERCGYARGSPGLWGEIRNAAKRERVQEEPRFDPRQAILHRSDSSSGVWKNRAATRGSQVSHLPPFLTGGISGRSGGRSRDLHHHVPASVNGHSCGPRTHQASPQHPLPVPIPTLTNNQEALGECLKTMITH
ncbi:uncharacterized protein LOC122236350 [Panthera tigris]|uniref:uncharacterized protein LOC122236350 n=1 Tax=Panthera tigris TaxID=9694 RepID=UPI001C6F623E|nr:uncharacterized protein LOC122236350 [Panthera tigris]